MSIKAELLSELDQLIKDGKKYDASYDLKRNMVITSDSDTQEHLLRAFVVKSYSAIERIAGQGSQYFRMLPEVKSKESLRHVKGRSTVIPTTLGILIALRDAVDQGLLVSLESRLRANIHDDFLQQAKALLDQSYHVAAMVLVGGVLEDHLEKLCTKHGKTVSGKGSLSLYNDALHSASAYDKPVWRRIQQIGDVRNHAAHGDFAKVNPSDVDDSWRYVGRIIADYPA